MKRFHLPAVAVMSIASTAFCATQLHIDGLINATIVPDEQGYFSAEFTLSNPGGFELAGFSLMAVNVPPGEVELVDFHNDNPIFPPVWQPCMIEPWLCPQFGPLEDQGELGSTGQPGLSDNRDLIPLRTLGFRLRTGVIVTDESPLVIQFRFDGYNSDFLDEMSLATITVIPEPAALLLLVTMAVLASRRHGFPRLGATATLLR